MDGSEFYLVSPMSIAEERKETDHHDTDILPLFDKSVLLIIVHPRFGDGPQDAP